MLNCHNEEFNRTFDSLFHPSQDHLHSPRKKVPVVMGHRGGFKPDNSMESFQAALDAGTIASIELDVSPTQFSRRSSFDNRVV